MVLNGIIYNLFYWLLKSEKSKVEEKKIVVQEDVVKLATENDQSNLRISGLKNELEMEKKKYEEDVAKLRRDKELLDKESSVLKQELEMTKRTCMQLEIETKGSAADLGDRLKELESLLTESKNKVKELESLLAESRNKVKELEANSETRRKNWIQKENICQSVMEFQLGALRVCTHMHTCVCISVYSFGLLISISPQFTKTLGIEVLIRFHQARTF